MKSQSLLFIPLIIFCFISCRKENLGFDDNQNTINHITNPTSYILKRQTWTGPTTNGESFLYKYNTNHLVSKIERYQWGTYSSNGGPQQTSYDTAYYTFEYTNGLCTKWRIQEGGADGYFIYEYNSQNLPVKRTLFYTYNNAVQSYSFYKYDNSNNLIEKVDSSNKVNFRYVFTYNNDNNLTSVTNYILWSNPQQKVKYEWLSFDNKVNFIKAVNGLPLTFIWDNNYHAYSSSSPNNYLEENYYSPVDINQPFDQANHSSNSYQFNDEGLPVKLFYGPWAVSFEYEKYK
jgi:hypothetical protein